MDLYVPVISIRYNPERIMEKLSIDDEFYSWIRTELGRFDINRIKPSFGIVLLNDDPYSFAQSIDILNKIKHRHNGNLEMIAYNLGKNPKIHESKLNQLHRYTDIKELYKQCEFDKLRDRVATYMNKKDMSGFDIAM